MLRHNLPRKRRVKDVVTIYEVNDPKIETGGQDGFRLTQDASSVRMDTAWSESLPSTHGLRRHLENPSFVFVGAVNGFTKLNLMSRAMDGAAHGFLRVAAKMLSHQIGLQAIPDGVGQGIGFGGVLISFQNNVPAVTRFAELRHVVFGEGELDPTGEADEPVADAVGTKLAGDFPAMHISKRDSPPKDRPAQFRPVGAIDPDGGLQRLLLADELVVPIEFMLNVPVRRNPRHAGQFLQPEPKRIAVFEHQGHTRANRHTPSLQ
jgi:hypothetical protein